MNNLRLKVSYNLLLNIPTSFIIALTAQLLIINSVDMWNLLLNYLVGYALAFLIGMVLPIEKIGRVFASLFNVDTENRSYKCVSLIATNFVFVTIVSLSCSFMNDFIIAGASVQVLITGWLSRYIILFVVGYCTTYLFNDVSLNIATKITRTRV